MRPVIAAFALSVFVPIVSVGRAAEPDAVRVASAQAAWVWASVPTGTPPATPLLPATAHAAQAAWAWASVPPCECGGTSPDCRCKSPPPAANPKPAPVAPAPKAGVCDRCPCADGKTPCTCSTACPAILSSYAEASAKAVAAQARLVVFIGPVAARQVPGCVVCRVHTLEGSGQARVMVGVPGRADRQLGRVDLAATATDAEILSVGLPVLTPQVQTQSVGFRAGPAPPR